MEMKLTELTRLTWSGPPQVKKNRQRILQLKTRTGSRPIIAPSADYSAAKKVAAKEIGLQYRGPALGSKKQPLRLLCMFYLPPRSAPDFDNLYTAALDILQSAGVLANDYFVLAPLPESDRVRDVERPRTEVVIYWQEDYEWRV